MSFDWSNYLYLAQELAGISPTFPPDLEARQRAAISRAYYAAYRTARTYLEDVENFTVNREYGSSHAQVINEFFYAKDRIKRSIARNLSDLRLLRESADYDPVFRAGKVKLSTNVQFVIGRAAAVLNAVDALYKKAQ